MYLRHIIASNSRLQLQGIRSASGLVSIPLEEIYVTLTATVRKRVRDEEAWLAEIAALAPGEAQRRGLHQPHESLAQVKVQVQEALALHPRLVVLGDPGSGKTTLLRYLALTYARDWVDDGRSTRDDGTWVQERLGLDERRLPVLLPLRDFARYLENECPNVGADGPKLLLDYLRVYFEHQQVPLPPDFFEARLETGECAVLLDSVDEVASMALRQRVARIVERFTVAYPENRYVVTSRIVGYTGGARLGVDYAVTTVRDFTSEDIARFARHWNRAVEVALAGEATEYVLRKAEAAATRLVEAIEANARVHELAVNPFLLTVIALVQRYRAQLPERRVELYEEAIEVLLVQWDAVKGLSATAVLQGLELDAGDRRSLLEPVALWMMEQRVREIELDDLRRLLAEPFSAMLKDLQETMKVVNGFIHLINARSGLLIERGQGIYAFSHLTFQEHLAARAVANREDYVEYTLERVGDSWWREVVLLEAGYLSTQGKRRATELIRALMEHPQEPEPYHNLVLAAEAVRDVGQARTEGDLAGEIQARLRRVFETPLRKGDSLPALIQRRAMAAEALGKIDSGVFGRQSAFWTLPYGEPTWVEIPAGSFYMGSKHSTAERPIHKVHLDRYYIAKTPITNKQYNLFVNATGHKAPRHWEDDAVPRGLEGHPVVNVTWHDARAYCAWLSEKTGKTISLPSEAEWEKAAEGNKGKYPWGNAWHEGYCNSAKLGVNGTTPVGIFQEGSSPYGVLEMAGNVWEWTCSLWGESEQPPQFTYPYVPYDGRENLDADRSMRRVLRGGSFDNEPEDVRCAYRISNTPDSFGSVIGFRVIHSPNREKSVVYEAHTIEDLSFYRLAVQASTTTACVGEDVHLTIKPILATADEGDLKLPSQVTEFYCFLSANGLQLQGSESSRLDLEANKEWPPSAEFDLQAQLCGDRPYTIELFAEDPDSGRISIYKTSGVITVHPPETIEDYSSILPQLDIRVAPQPDFVLNVTTALPEGDTGPHHLTYHLTSRLPGLHLDAVKVGTTVLRPADLARIQTLLQSALQQTEFTQPSDARDRLLSLGRYLFDQLFPPEQATAFRQALWQAEGRLATWLIQEDGHTWIPWELIVPYRDGKEAPTQWLAERYQLSHWTAGLGPPLYSEIPVGEVALVNYGAKEESDPEVKPLAWHKILQAQSVDGIFPAVKPETPFYGFHLLRQAKILRHKQELVMRDDIDIPTDPLERHIRQTRLYFRLKRPLIAVSILEDENSYIATGSEDWLWQDHIFSFLRAGASAVVAPWWPTSEAADQIFWPMFYELLMHRFPLGEAVWRARLAVRDTLPERFDWLAYTLFGDTRARAYWPEPSEGYTVLECLEPDAPLQPGKTYTFRASLRSRPPVWYNDRLVQSEPLPEQMRTLFLAPGIQDGFMEPVDMTPTGRTMLQATVDLKMPQRPGDYPLIAQLLEGDEHVKTLQLVLKVCDSAGGEES